VALAMLLVGSWVHFQIVVLGIPLAFDL